MNRLFDTSYIYRTPKLNRCVREHLRPGWVDFKVMRRASASLGQVAQMAQEVSADQRGHGIGVSLDVYTKSNIHASRPCLM